MNYDHWLLSRHLVLGSFHSEMRAERWLNHQFWAHTAHSLHSFPVESITTAIKVHLSSLLSLSHKHTRTNKDKHTHTLHISDTNRGIQIVKPPYCIVIQKHFFKTCVYVLVCTFLKGGKISSAGLKGYLSGLGWLSPVGVSMVTVTHICTSVLSVILCLVCHFQRCPHTFNCCHRCTSTYSVLKVNSRSLNPNSGDQQPQCRKPDVNPDLLTSISIRSGVRDSAQWGQKKTPTLLTFQRVSLSRSIQICLIGMGNILYVCIAKANKQ